MRSVRPLGEDWRATGRAASLLLRGFRVFMKRVLTLGFKRASVLKGFVLKMRRVKEFDGSFYTFSATFVNQFLKELYITSARCLYLLVKTLLVLLFLRGAR